MCHITVSPSNRLLHSVNSVRMWSYHPPALFPLPVIGSRMETDQVGNVGGKRGDQKESRPSQDPHRLNSDKQMKQQD
jgi:hypothetical protein